MKKKYLLHDSWKFSLKKTQEKVPSELKSKIKEGKWFNATVPGTVQTDLLNNKLIPEPFYSDNETKLQWIGKQNWTYKTSFDLPADYDLSKKLFIVMEGIDTSAIVILNGTMLGPTENMFLTYKFEISKLIIQKNNELEIIFISPEIYAKQLEYKYGQLPVALRSERVYLRKAQYSFGWDWGPAFLTQGIWRPIYLLQADEYCFENFSFSTISINEQNSKAKVSIKAKINKTMPSSLKLGIKLWDGNSVYEYNEDISETGVFSKEYELDDVKLWWPNGSGDSHLYNIQIKLTDDSVIYDEINKRVGIRTVELILKEKEVNTFRFQVNGHPVFAKGANWIPGDSFLPRVTSDKYERLLSLAKDGNMNIIRVWGGGIYENDIFYDLCDELGLMVWQDFMFACASYPEYKEFLENVSEEIKQNVYRLKNHSSIIIWCGNNENEWIWQRAFNKSYKEMPGYNIYNEVIPNILKEADPGRPYWESTPFGYDEDPNSENSGNRHQWDLWSNWIDYNEVEKDKSLFVTEFGFQAPANAETIVNVLPKDERYPQSKIFDFHNKQVEGPQRLIKFLSSHLPLTNKLVDFIYLTQLNQGFALKKCVEHWQSRFPETNGSIIWQINDVWPVSSWSLIDSNLIPKLAYYFVKQAFSPQIILFERKEKNVYVSIQNNSNEKYSGKARIQIISLPKGKVNNAVLKKVIIEPQEKRAIISVQVPNSSNSEKHVVIVSLLNSDGTIAQQNYFVEDEWKHLRLPKAKVKYKFAGKDSIVIKTDKPAFFVSLESPGIIFSHNGFILLPGEEIKVNIVKNSIHIKNPKSIKVSCLNEHLL